MRLTLALVLAGGLAAAAEMKLGKPLTLTAATPIATLVANPEPYLGTVVQVKGKITEVCQNMGCWMALVDPQSGKMVRVKVTDGEIVFPKDGAGRMATAEGKFSKIEMTRDQTVQYLKHQAAENKKKFDPASVTSGMTLYQLAGQGAVIQD